MYISDKHKNICKVHGRPWVILKIQNAIVYLKKNNTEIGGK